MAILRLFEQVRYAAPRVLPTASGQMLFPWAEGEGYLTTWTRQTPGSRRRQYPPSRARHRRPARH
ncbi:MAG: hypothetical protein VCF24_20850, partial [Candidatus Latescibacterota bacterium]